MIRESEKGNWMKAGLGEFMFEGWRGGHDQATD